METVAIMQLAKAIEGKPLCDACLAAALHERHERLFPEGDESWPTWAPTFPRRAKAAPWPTGYATTWSRSADPAEAVAAMRPGYGSGGRRPRPGPKRDDPTSCSSPAAPLPAGPRPDREEGWDTARIDAVSIDPFRPIAHIAAGA